LLQNNWYVFIQNISTLLIQLDQKKISKVTLTSVLNM